LRIWTLPACRETLTASASRGSNGRSAVYKANAKFQAELLREALPVLAGLNAQSKLKIVAGYYSLADGKVTLLD
jgi:hypothetical protein